MINNFKKPNLKGPRYREKRLGLLNKKTISEFKDKKPLYSEIDDVKLKNIIRLYNRRLWNEVIKNRERAFNFAVEKNKVPANLKGDYSKALRMVQKNVLVLYDVTDNNVIKEFCTKYDSAIRNQKDSFQEYRIAVSKLSSSKCS